MSQTLKSYARSIGAASTGLALAGIAAWPLVATAHEDHAPAAVQAADNLTVVRDATTGELRAPTAAEAQSLQRAAPARAGTRLQTLSRSHANGAKGARLTDEFMSSAVVARRADGSIAAQCVGTKEETDAALKAASTTTLTQRAATE